MIFTEGQQFERRRPLGYAARLLRDLHLDGPLLAGLLAISALGLIVLYSASGRSTELFVQQLVRFGIALVALIIAAQFPPKILRIWSPWGYLLGLVLLALVLLVGDIVMGAQRWLDLRVVQFQPSEIMKLAVPMIGAWYLHERRLPPHTGQLLALGGLILLPTLLIAKQPDLGTALLIASAGSFVILLAGLRVRAMLLIAALAVALAPLAWHLMHDYQRQRVLTFFVYVFVNVGMVTGLLPVVGVPLPLVSYGGTSMVTLMAGFGILMSIHTHRKLLPT